MIYHGNDFKISEDIHLVENEEGTVIVAGSTTKEKDSLGDIPII